PRLAAVSDHGTFRPVVAGQHAHHGRMAFRLKRGSIADLELEHLAMRTHLVQQSQTLHDTVVQVDEFRLSELVDVDLHGSLPSPAKVSTFLTWFTAAAERSRSAAWGEQREPLVRCSGGFGGGCGAFTQRCLRAGLRMTRTGPNRQTLGVPRRPRSEARTTAARRRRSQPQRGRATGAGGTHRAPN